MAYTQNMDGGNGFQIWSIAMNVHSKQTLKAERDDPPASKVRVNKSLRLKGMLGNVKQNPRVGQVL